jgi:hypothetical protein
MIRLLTLAALGLLAGCASVSPPAPLWPDTGACGLAHRPCDPGSVGQAEVVAALRPVQERFASHLRSYPCRFDASGVVLAGVLVGADGEVDDLRFAPGVDASCQAAVAFALQGAALPIARLDGQPHPSLWTLPFSADVSVTAAYLDPKTGNKW